MQSLWRATCSWQSDMAMSLLGDSLYVEMEQAYGQAVRQPSLTTTRYFLGPRLPSLAAARRGMQWQRFS